MSGYVQVQRTRGKTYFYLRPPAHLQSEFHRLKLDAATSEEAERIAADIISDPRWQSDSSPIFIPKRKRLDRLEERLERIEELLADIARRLDENGR
jgi:hypothetical protein